MIPSLTRSFEPAPERSDLSVDLDLPAGAVLEIQPDPPLVRAGRGAEATRCVDIRTCKIPGIQDWDSRSRASRPVPKEEP